MLLGLLLSALAERVPAGQAGAGPAAGPHGAAVAGASRRCVGLFWTLCARAASRCCRWRPWRWPGRQVQRGLPLHFLSYQITISS
ncbi:MAG: hypothetical protein WKG07_03520 [Hymenobacter sp.]